MADREIRCLSCFVKLDFMKDPRCLPCNHIYCLDCMKRDHIAGAQSYQCPSCGQIHEPIELEALPIPEAALNRNKQSTKLPSTGLLCEMCEAKSAVCYCSDCGKKLCEQHLKSHEQHYGSTHKTEDIEEFAQNIGQIERATTCSQHSGETVTMACKSCCQFSCAKCYGEADQRKCPVLGKHDLIPLLEVRNILTSHFQGLMKTSSSRVLEITRLEEDAQKKMSELKDSCETMLDQLEKRSRKHIETIQKQTQQLREEIQAYQTENTNKVYRYIGGLSEKEQLISKAQIQAHNFIYNSSITTLMEEHREKINLITEVNNLELGPCEWKIKKLCTTHNEAMDIGLQCFEDVHYGGGPFGTLHHKEEEEIQRMGFEDLNL